MTSQWSAHRVTLLTHIRPTLGAVRRSALRVAARLPGRTYCHVEWGRSSVVPVPLGRLLLTASRLLLSLDQRRRA